MQCHTSVAHVMIPSAVLMASLLGSGHCALMCGGLVVSAARTFWQNFFYHAGRLLGYLVLGGLSGWLGQNVATQFPAGVSEAVAWLVALSFIGLGVVGWKQGSWHLPIPGSARINQWTVRLFRQLTDTKKPQRAYYAGAIGLLSIFLPCGWLYSFVLASASIADPLKSAAMMGVFWAGTVPALVISPLLLRKVFSVTEGVAPKVSSLLLIAAGLFPILLRYIRF